MEDLTKSQPSDRTERDRISALLRSRSHRPESLGHASRNPCNLGQGEGRLPLSKISDQRDVTRSELVRFVQAVGLRAKG